MAGFTDSVRALAAAMTGDGQDDGDGQEPCEMCDGVGVLKHPRTGKFTQSCPGCSGSGLAPEEEVPAPGDKAARRQMAATAYEQAHARRAAENGRARLQPGVAYASALHMFGGDG